MITNAARCIKESNLLKRIMKESLMASSASAAIISEKNAQELYTVPGIYENFFEVSGQAPLVAAKNIAAAISPKSDNTSTETSPQCTSTATNESSILTNINIDTAIPFDAFNEDTNLPSPMLLNNEMPIEQPMIMNNNSYEDSSHMVPHCHPVMYPPCMNRKFYIAKKEPSTFSELMRKTKSLFDCRKRREFTTCCDDDEVTKALVYDAKAMIGGPSLEELETSLMKQVEGTSDQPTLDSLDIARIVQQYNRLEYPFPGQAKQMYNIPMDAMRQQRQSLDQEQPEEPVMATQIFPAEALDELEAEYPETPSRQCSLDEAMSKLLGVTIANSVGWTGETDAEGSPVVRKKSVNDKAKVRHPYSRRGRLISKIKTFFGRAPWDDEPVPVKHVPFFFAMTPKSVEPENLIFHTKDGKKWILSVYQSARIGSASAYVQVNPFIKR